MEKNHFVKESVKSKKVVSVNCLLAFYIFFSDMNGSFKWVKLILLPCCSLSDDDMQPSHEIYFLSESETCETRIKFFTSVILSKHSQNSLEETIAPPSGVSPLREGRYLKSVLKVIHLFIFLGIKFYSSYILIYWFFFRIMQINEKGGSFFAGDDNSFCQSIHQPVKRKKNAR